MRHQKHLILLAAATCILAAAGCGPKAPDNAAYVSNANTNPAAQKQASGKGGANIAQPMAAPPGYKTGDLSGGKR